MKFPSWRNKENLLAVGLRWVWFFMPCLVAGFKPVSQLFLHLNTQPCESAMKQNAEAQGFMNLNFESANIPNSTSPNSPIPITAGLPNWSGYFISSTATNQVTQVTYDGISLGGNAISVIDSNAPSFEPLQGRYSAFLFGGGSDPFYSATISQTGMVPSGTESLLIDAYLSGASFVVTLGGQTINMVPLQTFSNYTLYGGDISSFAGELETLSFT